MDAFGVSDAFHHDDIWVWAYISHCDPLQRVERWGDREKEHCPCVCVCLEVALGLRLGLGLVTNPNLSLSPSV